MSYLIKKDNKTNTITYMQYDMKGYKFTPKSQKNASIQVNQIVIINPQMIDKILTLKFNSTFKKLMAFVLNYLNDTSSDTTDGIYALGEIDRLKSIIFNKYQAYLSVEKQKNFLDKLAFLENQINMKMMMAYQFMPSEYQEEQTQGRGR